MTRPDWIAVDWGTSHLRLWRMSGGGTVLGRSDSDKGMGKLSPEGFEPVLLDLLQADLPDEGTLPVVCCGMVGSRQGWVEARYLPVPGPVPGMAQATRAPTRDPRLAVHILPGLSQSAPADVMRGEETQIGGFLSTQPDFDGVVCLPGTHCKWAEVRGGVVETFATFMTGEMFALLSGQSVLRHGVAESGFDAAAFDAAVSQALSRPQALAADLFSLRAEGLLAGLDGVAARSRLSGLLIGAELAAARPFWLGQAVVILGASGLAQAYHAALAAQGVTAQRVDAEEMTLNGLRAAFRQLEKDKT